MLPFGYCLNHLPTPVLFSTHKKIDPITELSRDDDNDGGNQNYDNDNDGDFDDNDNKNLKRIENTNIVTIESIFTNFKGIFLSEKSTKIFCHESTPPFQVGPQRK